MQHSEQINEIAAALAKAQGAIKAAVKDSINPHFKSRYADLASVWDACRAPLSENGLAVIQTPFDTGSPDTIGVETMLVHTSGQFFKTTMIAANGKSIQGAGSAITYMRRYMLSSMVGVVADEDDDGNAGSAPRRDDREERQPEPRQPRQPSRQQSAQPEQSAPEPRNIAAYISLGKKAVTIYGYTRDEVAAAIARALPTGDEARAMTDADYSKLIADLEALERRALQEGRGKQIEAPAQD